MTRSQLTRRAVAAVAIAHAERVRAAVSMEAFATIEPKTKFFVVPISKSVTTILGYAVVGGVNFL